MFGRGELAHPDGGTYSMLYTNPAQPTGQTISITGTHDDLSAGAPRTHDDVLGQPKP